MGINGSSSYHAVLANILLYPSAWGKAAEMQTLPKKWSLHESQ